MAEMTKDMYGAIGKFGNKTFYQRGGKTIEWVREPSPDPSAVRLPYGNGAYQMTVILPRQGKDISDVLDKMDGKNWQLRGGNSMILDLKLPRFETDTDIDLIPVMKALGMSTAFTEYADFPDFCNVPIFIDLMKQVAKIKVNEEGTEAAAITIIGAETSSIPSIPPHAKFHATRPFLYIISEQSTSAIFFIGQYMGDTTSDITSPRLQYQTENGPLYNLAGQRLTTPPSHGIYIQNGKKVIK